MLRAFTGPILALFVSGALSAQSFEVASIKPAPPPGNGPMRVGSMGGPGTRDPGRFTCENCSLSNLITQAYDIRSYQLSAPSWLDTERFIISATVPEGATKEQFRVMQQNLLKERFGLTFHREKKEMPMYELTVGKNGPKMKESVEAPAGQDSAPSPFPPGPPKLDKEGFPVLPPGGRGMAIMNGRARMQASQQTMEQFAGMLSGQLGKPVTDATGLKGKYDFELYWVASGMMGFGGRGLPVPPPEGGAGAAPVVSDPDSGPTLIGAVQEQLGLKLEQKKGPVDIIVIDHIEKVPTEN